MVRLCQLQDFDAGMVFCLKSVLSYYERSTDRILSDYLYYIAIPLIYAFGSMKRISIT